MPAAERDALIAIYNATDGANWTDNTNWNTAAPVNTWSGVTVENNVVTRLELIGNNLNGTLPNDIGNLVNLEFLTIRTNLSLSGTLPATLGNLSNIELLTIDNTSITGNIPIEITNLQNLTNLNLAKNLLTGQLPPELGNLTNLMSFIADTNQLDGSIPPELGNLTNLTTLILGFNNLTGAIPTTFENLTNMANLNISNNNLTGPIPEGFANMSNLELIFISFNQLTGEIPEGFGNIAPLRAIALNNNQLTGTVPDSFNNLTNLTFLRLDQNNLEGILPNFTSNPGLNYLDFKNNNFEFGDFENQHTTYSTYANYGNNPQSQVNIEETRYANIGNSIDLSTTVGGSANTYQWYKGIYPGGALLPGETNEILNFPAIQATDAGDYYCVINNTIVTDLTLVRRPIHLNVENGGCEVTDRDALTRLYNLTDGPNWTNNTNWNTAAPLDTWFGVTTDGGGCVISLDLNPTDNNLGSNNLTGTLPKELGNLQSLEFLDLSYGNISGSIPDEITNITSLIQLDISTNNLSGTIPNTIDNLINLQNLNLTSNQLTSNIPISLTNLSNLRNLRLRVNNLSGTIPLAITNLTELRVLELGSNDFTGTIYPEYGNLINLNVLELQQNQLVGSIPIELGNLVNMRDLRLGHQDLTGTLPASLGNLANMELLNIEVTSIGGSIPIEYENMASIRSLSLGQNELSGTIPEIFNNLTQLIFLNLSNNQLSGNIPTTLLSCSNLTFLFFGSNELEGSIPNLTALPLLQNLSFNNNRFEFGDFENQHPIYTSYTTYNNNPQAKVDTIETQDACTNENITLSTIVSGTQNTYQWYKGVHPSGTLLAGETNSDLIFNNVQLTDSGDYYCIIDSNIVNDLTLVRNQITLNVVSSSIIANPIDSIEICDGNNDGFETFTIDISDIESQVLGTQTGLTVSYFDDLGTPISLTNSFTNTTINSQTITVRVSNGATCFDETTLELIVNPSPLVDILTGGTFCGDYELPTLTSGSYYTGIDGTGIPLNAGDKITSSQTIYIYENVNNCSDQSSFSITINTPSPVDALNTVNACESFTLPSLTNGNYYTGSNASSTPLSAGDLITTSDTIYIYNNSNGCPSESSFDVTIIPLDNIIDLPNQYSCDSFTLPTLTSGNYYTQQDGLGAQVSPNDIIENSQTIYIYDDSSTCPIQSRYTIVITPSPMVDQLNDFSICDSFTLPSITNGNYYTDTNGTGTQLNAGSIVNSSQVLYIYNEVNTPFISCSSEHSFNIEIFPTNDFSLTDSNINIDQETITITMDDNSINYEYAIDNGPFQSSNSFTDLIDGEYTLFVRDSNGCVEKSTSFTIFIDKFIVPSFFTPNGDNQNDTWLITDTRNTITKIRIFNRYGKLLKEISPQSPFWDGTFNNNLMSSNDYWYLIEGNRDGKPYVLRGHFALKR